MPAKYANNARSKLFSGINSSALNFSLISGGGASFPAAGGSDYFYATLIDAENIPEIVKVTSRTDDSFIVVRGQDGTVARAFAANAEIILGITKASLEEFAQKDGSNASGTWPISISGNAPTATTSGKSLVTEAANAGTTTGSATAYALAPTAAIASYAANLSFWVKFHVASGTKPTLQISGLASPPLLVRYNAGGGLVNIGPGDLPAGYCSRVTLLGGGQALVEKMPPSAGSVGLGNVLTNGAMQVYNRGSVVLTAGADLAFALDRWFAYSEGAGVSHDRETSTDRDTGRARFIGGAGVTKIGFGQRVPSADCAHLAGGMVSLSAALRNTQLGTVTWTVWTASSLNSFGTKSSPTRTLVSSGTFSVSATEQRYDASFSLPAEAARGIEVEFSVGAQTGGVWTICDVQLIPGEVALPFERKPLAVEQISCERYLGVLQVDGEPLTVSGVGLGIATSTTLLSVTIPLRVPLSFSPSTLKGLTPITQSVARWRLSDGVSSITPTSVTVNTSQSSPTKLVLEFGATGLTQFRPYFVRANMNSSVVPLLYSNEL